MYVQGLGLASLPVAATASTPFLLPNTGSSMIVTTAISIAAGMLIWGLLYSLTSNRAG